MSTTQNKLEKFADKFMPSGVEFSELKTERLWVLLIFASAIFAALFLLLDVIVVVGPATYLCASLTLLCPIYLWLFTQGLRGISKLLLHAHAIIILFIITLIYTDAGFAWTFIIPALMSSVIIFTRRQLVHRTIIQVLIFAFIPLYLVLRHYVTPMEFNATSMFTFKIVNLSGSLAFCLLILNTITRMNNKIQEELKVRVEENVKQNKIMLGSMRTRDKLLSMMSHDIRGDIGKTIGVVDVIEQMNLSKEDQANLLRNLKIDATKTLETLDNMLQWTRTQQDELHINQEVYEVDRLISLQLSNHEYTLNSKRINVKLDIPGRLRIWADVNMIDSVFRNLIGNAIKFTPIGGVIAISAKQIEGEVEFCIQDSGVGMTQEQIENIIKGVQFTTRGTNREKGRGFGMVLVSEFLSKHKTQLHIESTVGKGTRFTFRLPIPTTN